MSFKGFLHEQIELHPSVQPQDIVKQCYQAAFGAEHLLSDITAAQAYFESEYDAATQSDAPLYERISPHVYRVNLSAWKKSALPPKWLFRMFVMSAGAAQSGNERFIMYLRDADETVKSGKVLFSNSDWLDYLTDYKKNGMGAVHHSALYRQREHPSYRVVNRKFIRLLPVLIGISRSEKRRKPFVLAIDGRAASGKTTAAEQLERILEGSIIHMDDFFLPAPMRTAVRLDEPGGNVHYERFADEVLVRLREGEDFSYRVFDCATMDYSGVRNIAASSFYIVEGCYSCHPAFEAYADFKVFCDITGDEQIRRIVLRNGNDMAERFRTQWIPLEERYFASCRTKEAADAILDYPSS